MPLFFLGVKWFFSISAYFFFWVGEWVGGILSDVDNHTCYPHLASPGVYFHDEIFKISNGFFGI